MVLKKKLVIDTDGVADDVRAVSLALQHPDVDVLGITCVNGCVNVEQAVANFARTLRANGKEAKIYKGAELPLIGNKHTHIDEVGFFGSDGIGDAPNAFPEALAEDFETYEHGTHAALALCQIFGDNPGTTLVCIGPLTNVALALKLEPKFARLPEKIVILGGNVYGMGNVHSMLTAEFNFSNDPEAAHIVLKEMQCPITIVPWETFMFESGKSAVDFHAHLSIDAPLARFFGTAVKLGRIELERNGRQYAYCDEIAVGVAIDPDHIIKEAKYLRASVELHGELTRGQVAIDWTEKIWQNDVEHPKVCKKRSAIEFVMNYNVEFLDKMIVDTINRSCNENAIENEKIEAHNQTLQMINFFPKL